MNGEKTETPEQARSDRSRTMRFLVFWLVLAGALLGGNFLYGLVGYTRSDRGQCLSCHESTGPARMWALSARHSEGLACVQCHGAPPAREGRRGAFSAKADVVNPNCVGCHPRVLTAAPIGKAAEVKLGAQGDENGGGRIYRWKLEDLMSTWHLDKKVSLCTDCHRNVAHEKAPDAKAPNRPKLAYCGECHYHAAKDDYVKARPVPVIEIVEVRAAGE
ncbi:MAG: hypothetical protein AB1640_15970 [bacterium]